jgi:predicted ATPase with chaperone activity
LYPVCATLRVPASELIEQAALSPGWWETSTADDDVQGFLLAHLTSPAAVVTPLVVLGQPGSGKSAMTKTLAAPLPAPDPFEI